MNRLKQHSAHIQDRVTRDGTQLPEHVTVVGAARSGRAAAQLLAAHGVQVFVTDAGPIHDETAQSFSDHGISFEAGGHTGRAMDTDLVVTSPGVPPTAAPLAGAAKRSIPVWSEIELASRCMTAPMVAVTGSNGKTTTTELLGHIFRTAGCTTHVCGNVGTPFSEVAPSVGPNDVVVLEVSSYQLENVHTFRPRISLLLNVSPDHLDRYGGSMEAYAATKFRIAARQQAGDTCIYSDDDERLVQFVAAGGTRARTLAIGLASGGTFHSDADRAGWVEDNALVLSVHNNKEVLMQLDDLALRGRHNVYNSLAAAVAARVMEVRSELVRESLHTFSGVPHRLETVRTVDGVAYVNDSKATNVNAVWYALESFREDIVLIAGGRDKSGGYEALRPLVEARVRGLVTIGESAPMLEAALGDCVADCVRASDMTDAVRLATLLARQGDVVLLSPACSSFDMYDNFEARGDHFRRIVSTL